MLRAVGQLEQFAKETFARETASVTHGAASWQLPPELNMSEVRIDGLLLMHHPALLAALASLAGQTTRPAPTESRGAGKDASAAQQAAAKPTGKARPPRKPRPRGRRPAKRKT